MHTNRFRTRSARQWALFSVSVFIVGLALLAQTPPQAQAAMTWTVSPNSTGACTKVDPNCATLTSALKAAARDDTIQLTAGTFTENVILTENVTLIGAGAGTTILDGGYGAGCTGTAPLEKEVMVVLSGVTAHISDLTLQHGCIIETGNPIIEGGGLSNHGTAYLERVIVQNNTVRGPMGGGGGISNETRTGILFLTDVILADNTAEEGAGLDNDHYSTLMNVSIFGNHAVGRARADGEGGGIENGTLEGAAITMTNVTLYMNTAVKAGGAIAADHGTIITATNVTIDRNTAPRAGGILNEGIVKVTSSIVANSAGGNCTGPLVTSGQNLSTDGTCVGFAVNANPGLSGILAANGAFAPTEALMPGSPALNAIVNCATSNCDLGAFVVSAPSRRPVAAPTLSPSQNSTGPNGQNTTNQPTAGSDTDSP